MFGHGFHGTGESISVFFIGDREVRVIRAQKIDHFVLLETHLCPMDLMHAIGLAVVLFWVWLTVK